MIESTLWKHLKPELGRVGKFQRITDRFVPGIPDVLGTGQGRSWAIELKEFDGVRVLRLEFRPGQLHWLEEWANAGGISLIVASLGQRVMVYNHTCGPALEKGVSPEVAVSLASVVFLKTRVNKWKSFVSSLMELN